MRCEGICITSSVTARAYALENAQRSHVRGARKVGEVGERRTEGISSSITQERNRNKDGGARRPEEAQEAMAKSESFRKNVVV